MPQLGETVTEGTIVRWFKQVGDAISRRRRAVRGVHREGRHRGALRPRRLPARGPRGRGRHRPGGRPRSRSSPITADEPVALDESPVRRGRSRGIVAVPAVPAAVAGAPKPRLVRHRPSRRPTATGFSRPSCAACSTSTVWTRTTSWARAVRAHHPSRRAGRGRQRPPPRRRRRHARHRRPPATGRPVPTAGPDDEVLEFTRRLGATTADHMMRSLATRAHTLVGHRGRLPRRRSGSPRAAGLQLPAVRRPGGHRRPGRVPHVNAQRRRRRAHRAPCASTSASRSTSTSRASSCRWSATPAACACAPSPTR